MGNDNSTIYDDVLRTIQERTEGCGNGAKMAAFFVKSAQKAHAVFGQADQ